MNYFDFKLRLQEIKRMPEKELIYKLDTVNLDKDEYILAKEMEKRLIHEFNYKPSKVHLLNMTGLQTLCGEVMLPRPKDSYASCTVHDTQ